LPGFLSLFDETERIVLSPPGADKEFWVAIKHYLTGEEEDEITDVSFGAQGMQLSAIAGMDEQQIKGRMDLVAQSRVLLRNSIINWNLTDRDDNPLPLAPRAAKEASIASLPGGVRDIITKRIAEIRKDHRRTPAERAAFRGAASGGDLDGDGGADGAGGVPDGVRVLEAPRTDEGNA
jgi:hypothetical protein